MDDSRDDPSQNPIPQTRAATSITDLPPEILQKIFEHLHPFAPPRRTRWLLRSKAYAKALPVTMTELRDWEQHMAIFSVMLVSRDFFRHAMWLLTGEDWDTFSTDEKEAWLGKVRGLRTDLRQVVLGEWREICRRNAGWRRDACEHENKWHEEEVDRWLAKFRG